MTPEEFIIAAHVTGSEGTEPLTRYLLPDWLLAELEAATGLTPEVTYHGQNVLMRYDLKGYYGLIFATAPTDFAIKHPMLVFVPKTIARSRL